MALPRLVLVGLTGSLLLGAPARAAGTGGAAGTDRTAPVGFALQAVLGGAVPLVSSPGGGTAPAGATLRLGLHSRPILAALSLGYQGMSAPAGGGLHALTAGVDLMPTVWEHRDGRARLYVLLGGGVGLGIADTGPPGGEAPRTAVSGGFSVGLGGRYLLHPGYALGVEVGARTQLFREGDAWGAQSGLYGAMTGTFATGG